MQDEHEQVELNNFKCGQCDETLLHKSSLKNHVKMNHQAETVIQNITDGKSKINYEAVIDGEIDENISSDSYSESDNTLETNSETESSEIQSGEESL